MIRGNYRSENIVYKAIVISELETSFYISFLNSVKIQIWQPKKYFYCSIYENGTEISKYICGLKRKNIDHKITWDVIKRDISTLSQPIRYDNNPICHLCIK